MDFKEQYQSYDKTLNELRNQCSEAEKEAIVADTNLQNLRKQREQLIEECETYAGVPMDNIPEILNKKKEELDSIMIKLSGLTNGPITPEKLEEIKALSEDFSMTNPV